MVVNLSSSSTIPAATVTLSCSSFIAGAVVVASESIFSVGCSFSAGTGFSVWFSSADSPNLVGASFSSWMETGLIVCSSSSLWAGSTVDFSSPDDSSSSDSDIVTVVGFSSAIGDSVIFSKTSSLDEDEVVTSSASSDFSTGRTVNFSSWESWPNVVGFFCPSSSCAGFNSVISVAKSLPLSIVVTLSTLTSSSTGDSGLFDKIDSVGFGLFSLSSSDSLLLVSSFSLLSSSP